MVLSVLMSIEEVLVNAADSTHGTGRFEPEEEELLGG
jgi:hypothetical protein